MLKTRALVAVGLLPLVFIAVYFGGWVFGLAIAVLVALASLEFAGLFHAGGHTLSGVLVACGSMALALSRAAWGFEYTPLLISLVVLLSMVYYLLQYERGSDRAASDFAITLAGIFYIGWLGAYLISLRALSHGDAWVMTVLIAIWAADSFAYLVGSRIGRHKMTPRLSPKKSWEGYIGGIVFAIPITAGFVWLWGSLLAPFSDLTLLRGALIGLAMAVLPILGDLGESMIKRQFGVKDSGAILPGHGGVFDRIDSWLWGAVIAYYIITMIFGVG